PDWRPLVGDFFQSEAGQALGRQVTARLNAGATVYPLQPLRALELTPLSEVRVLILGQDPYHGPGQAEGLAFSVARGVKLPPSLRNIYQELAQDPLLKPWTPPAHGSLQDWARKGVLLLNTCLTVEDGQPASHARYGWEVLTTKIIQAVAAKPEPVVFMLWGAHAQKAAKDATAASGQDLARRHLILAANHPSPLSARRGAVPFMGCGHFG
ncbi:uracil-DNA glycosylase, partial [Leptospira sp. SA-E8]|uniref:uracil-DNA glycosylase n=1 Tax=Leptospira sp. SA-E8 TaxID=3422259 RepID=UPI003EBCBDC4